jgi:sulfonate transport system substrate-binding protein
MRIGGVPEHYNAPIHMALAKLPSTEFLWRSFPSGTGDMLDALDNAEIDMAVLLTEGVTKHALTTGRSKIVGTFVNNPLPWGVHVRPDSDLTSMAVFNEKISTLRFGISRIGSGSHLMAIVHASALRADAPTFKIIDTMKGARDAMAHGEIDAFLWDIATADVYAREGVWTCIGTVSGEWPAFVFAVSTSSSQSDQLGKFLTVLADECRAMKQNHDDASIVYLKDTYKLSDKQASDFIRDISWNANTELSRSALYRVIKSLKEAGIIPDQEHDPTSVVMKQVCDIVE